MEPTSQSRQPGEYLRIAGEGVLDHLRAAERPWMIVDRPADDPDSVETTRVVFRGRTKRSARQRVQELRTDLERGRVLDLLEWVTAGWRLYETLPQLCANSMDGSKEIIWGHTGEPIALIEPDKLSGWRLWMATEIAGEYHMPDRGSLFFTRADAVTAARQLSDDRPSNDVDWPERWKRALRVTIAARHSVLMTPITVLGPTGLTCAYPGCETEAETLVSVDGSDIAGEPARLCCYTHGGQVSFPMLHPDLG